MSSTSLLQMACTAISLATALRLLVSASLLAYAFFFISGTLDDWSENPVQTVIESTSFPVQNLPFPAITVCPGEGNRPMTYGFMETFLNFVRWVNCVTFSIQPGEIKRSAHICNLEGHNAL